MKCKYCWIRQVKKQWDICLTCHWRFKKAVTNKEIIKANQILYKLSNTTRNEINSILDTKKNNIKKTNKNRYLYTLIYLIDILIKKDKEILIKYYFKVKDVIWPLNNFIEQVMISKWYDKSNKEIQTNKEIQVKDKINTIQLVNMLKKISNAFDDLSENKSEEFIIELWDKWYIDNEEQLEKIMNITKKYKKEIDKINKERKKYNKQYYNIIIKMLNEIDDKELQKIFYKNIWGYFQYVYVEIKPLIDLIIKKYS